HKYSWRSELDSQVRQGFQRKAAKRLKDMHHWVTLKRKGVRPIWMPEEIHQQLIQKTKEDEFKKKSEQAKKNKRGGSLEGVVEPGHCQGSISTAEYAKRMAAKNGGVLPKAADIYLETHSKERQPGQGKQLIGSKSKQIMVSVLHLLQ
ncbi:hypothetical protein BVRB_019430, partial [Beta vulgaris subsp. vulgaris]